MSIINTSYFIQDIAIPNMDRNPNGFNTAIDRYEKEVLISLLGYRLYTSFIAGINEKTPDQKWLDLRDGKDFSFELSSRTVYTRWNGFKNVDKISLIAYYVYYKYRYNLLTQVAGIGDVIGKSENSDKVSDIPKLVEAWNTMIDLYGPTKNFNGEEYLTYNDYPSAYNFLNAHRETYENWEFHPLKYINRFGL